MKRLSSLLGDKRYFAITFIGLCLFALVIRLFRLQLPSTYYFDEVYHGFTATTFLHNDPKGYEFWQSPPAGVAYEWTHPPLAKLMMAGGMVVFGENSYGWRVSSALMGTGIVVLVGILTHRAFRNRKMTLLAVLFTSIEGLLLSMSRIAMNDSHFIFFMLAALLCYMEYKPHMYEKTWEDKFAPLFGTAVFLGLALASKWTALYVGAGIVVDQVVTVVWRRKFPSLLTMVLTAVLLAAVPLSVYFLSYTQFFLEGHTFTQFKDTQQQMWWYHTNLKATHGYQSRPLQWIFDLRPVWMYVDYSQNSQGIVAHIYNVGNPVLLWGGLITVFSICTWIGAAKLQAKKRTDIISWELWFLLLMYAVLWVPWIISPRIMFFYHYAPALPFLLILLSYGLVKGTRNNPKLSGIIPGFVILAVIAFMALYPLNTGYPMPASYFEKVFSLFPMWK